MAKAGLKGNTPVVNVERGTLDQKRQVEFYVHDIESTLGRLNVTINKCAKVNVKVTFGIQEVDGVQRIVLVSAELP